MEEGLGGTRSAYLEFPRVLRELGSPCVLAATATATERTVRQVGELLGIENVVLDDVREIICAWMMSATFHCANRLVYHCRRGGEMPGHVNSRDQSISLRAAASPIPELGQSIAFTTRGLPLPSARGWRRRFVPAR